MEGFPGNTPLVVKNISSSNKQVVSVEELFKKIERKNGNIRRMRSDWNKILKIKRDKTVKNSLEFQLL